MVRFYDPTTGTFLSRDPIEASTRSAYGYVGNSPTNATDPSGLMCWNPTDRDCLSEWGDNLIPDDVRPPDYITIDATAFLPWVGPIGPGIGVNVSISRSGEIFIGPQGGVGAGGGGGIRAGWLDAEPSCDDEIDAFLDGDFVSFGFQAGASGAKTISNNGSTSTEAGLGGPVEGSGVVGHSWNPFRLPFDW